MNRYKLSFERYLIRRSIRAQLYPVGNWSVTGFLLVPDGTSNATRGWRTFLCSQSLFVLTASSGLIQTVFVASTLQLGLRHAKRREATSGNAPIQRR